MAKVRPTSFRSLLGWSLAGSIAAFASFAAASPTFNGTWLVEGPPPQVAIGASAVALQGGSLPSIEIDLEPIAVVVNGGREKIEYAATIRSNLSEQGGVAWSAYITDDLGNAIVRIGEGQGAVIPKGRLSTARLANDLPDGFYALYVRAAIHSASGDDGAEAVQHLTVARGKMREMTFEEWIANSRGAMAKLATGGVR